MINTDISGRPDTRKYEVRMAATGLGEDYPESLERLFKEAVETEPLLFRPIQLVSLRTKKGGVIYYVIDRETDQVVSFMLFSFVELNNKALAGAITLLYVSKASRGKGLGTSMIDRLKVAATACRYLYAPVVSGSRSEKFWSKLGFTCEDEYIHSYPDGSTDELKAYAWSEKHE